MLDKLQAIEDKYLDLEAKISDPDIIADQKEWQKCTKAHAKLTDIVTVFREYSDLVKAKSDLNTTIQTAKDIKVSDYTFETVLVFNQALISAQTIYNTSNNISEITAATANLVNAISALILADISVD